MLHRTTLFLAALAVCAPAFADPVFAKPTGAKPTATDWSRITRATPSGGYVMGNPSARVKLIEYGSLTCSHCAHFDAEGAPSLISDYVRGGRVSWEFRSFLLNGVDIPATLTATCAGPSRFFPVARALYANQRDWVAKVQAIPADRLTAIQALSEPQQFRAIGEAAGLPALAATQGIPAAKVEACLAKDARAKQAAKVTADGAQRLNVKGTPTFFVNGVKVDYSNGPSVWGAVKSGLDAALKR